MFPSIWYLSESHRVSPNTFIRICHSHRQKSYNLSYDLRLTDLFVRVPMLALNNVTTCLCWRTIISHQSRVCIRLKASTVWSLKWRHNDHNGVSNHQPHDCLLNHLFRQRWKKTSKLCVTGLCAGNSPVTGEFPALRASNAENVSIWLRHDASFEPRNSVFVLETHYITKITSMDKIESKWHMVATVIEMTPCCGFTYQFAALNYRRPFTFFFQKTLFVYWISRFNLLPGFQVSELWYHPPAKCTCVFTGPFPNFAKGEWYPYTSKQGVWLVIMNGLVMLTHLPLD